MAGSITETRGKVYPPRTPVLVVRLAWTSTAGGAVSGITTGRLNGTLNRARTIPGTGGVAPTAGYSVQLLDSDGIDVLSGSGGGRSATVTEDIPSGVPIVGTLQLVVAGAGAAKQGTVVLYFGEA